MRDNLEAFQLDLILYYLFYTYDKRTKARKTILNYFIKLKRLPINKDNLSMWWNNSLKINLVKKRENKKIYRFGRSRTVFQKNEIP